MKISYDEMQDRLSAVEVTAYNSVARIDHHINSIREEVTESAVKKIVSALADYLDMDKIRESPFDFESRLEELMFGD